MAAFVVLFCALACNTTAWAQAPDRSRPPAIGLAPTIALPKIHKGQLSNGIPVWIVEAHEVPVVQVNLVIKTGTGGTSADPQGKFGIGSLTAAMLMEGAGSRSSLELADAVDFLGADLNSTIGFDSWAVRLHVPVARLGEALPLLADVALRPTFPAAELERLRQQRLTSLTQAKDDASSIASAALSRILFREGRFGTLTIGTANTISAFTVSDVAAFYRAQLIKAPTLLVVGDVTPNLVMPLLEQHFRAWRSAGGGAGPSITGRSGPLRTTREVYLLDKPGAPQSQIRIGVEGVSRDTADYFPIQVMNTVLGGSFSSRLNMNLREQHGYTYGATSLFDMRQRPGPFVASAGVQTDKTSEALTEFFKELNGIHQAVPPAELARSKNYVALRYPAGFETTTDISRRLEDALVYSLPGDYFAKYVPAINAVTAADVERVARKYVTTDRVAIVIVGDRQVIEPGIRALGLGPIKTLSLDQVFDDDK